MVDTIDTKDRVEVRIVSSAVFFPESCRPDHAEASFQIGRDIHHCVIATPEFARAHWPNANILCEIGQVVRDGKERFFLAVDKPKIGVIEVVEGIREVFAQVFHTRCGLNHFHVIDQPSSKDVEQLYHEWKQK